MVSNQHAIDLVFTALGDSTRRAIVARLAAGDAKVGELAEPFRVSRPAISKHLCVLERARIVRRTRVGRECHCSLEPAALQDAANWLDHYRRFWESQLDALQRHAERKAVRGKESGR